MNLYTNIVTEDDTRSAGAGIPSKCFYCNGRRGGPHDPECVCLKKPIKIKVTLELIDVRPRSWSKHDIESHYNESSWCANNIVPVIQRHLDHDDDLNVNLDCLCQRMTVEYLGDATVEEAEAANLTEETEE
jgi:hypothetical protein